MAAIETQIDELTFAPRRFTCEPAVELAEKLAEHRAGRPRQGAVHHRRVGRHRGRAEGWRARRPAGSRRSASGMRFTAPASARPASAAKRPFRSRASPARCWPAPNMSRRLPATAAPTAMPGPECLRPRLRRAWSTTCWRARATSPPSSPSRCAPCPIVAAARLLADGARGLRPPRRAADLRRDPDRAWQDRPDVRLRARRRGAGHPRAGQGAGRRHPADRGRRRAPRSRCRAAISPSAITRTRRTR